MKKLMFLCIPFLLVNCNQKENKKETEEVIPAEEIAIEEPPVDLKVAVFAEGCYWCTEYVFEAIPGVETVVSGFTGGNKDNLDYNKVVKGEPRHAEGVQIFYDENVVSFEELVNVFFASHDPTTVNQQGPDKGEEYRSIAFYTTEEERQSIVAKIAKLTAEKAFDKPIVTEVKLFETFLPVKEEQQDYIKKNPNDPYVISESIPRINRFVAKYKGKLKKAQY
ncbi:MAG: peptide-methionine (S)-S-oxide reductase MsrA [Flavobacterium sp.]|nr:peptide-methionine (S)-S-oxide reductase MsrA [Flavobacterium sp.]